MRRPAALALCIAAASAPASAIERAALDRAIDVEHAAGRFDGVVLVGVGDDVAYRKAVGFADREAKIEHRVDESWRWASVSKQVAAVLAMREVEAGSLSLDASIDTWLPDFAAPHAARIRLRDLLQHTSGLPNPDDSPLTADGVPSFYRLPSGEVAPGDPDQLVASLRYCAGAPNAEPGPTFSYNNCDTLVLQAILERVSGLPYAALVEQRLTRPLGLASLRFAVASPVARGKMPKAGGGERSEVGSATSDAVSRTPESRISPVGYAVDGKREPPFDLSTFGAGGALHGSADDLWRFDRALIDGALLDAASMQMLWTGDPALGYVALGAWSFEAPLAGCDGAVALVERRGEIGGIQVRNLIAAKLQAALIVFSNTSATSFGEIWQGSGLTYTLASAAFCADAAAE
jgi:D-alanyl-D-alanine carboxypeptidase